MDPWHGRNKPERCRLCGEMLDPDRWPLAGANDTCRYGCDISDVAVEASKQKVASCDASVTSPGGANAGGSELTCPPNDTSGEEESSSSETSRSASEVADEMDDDMDPARDDGESGNSK
jgi:hypothetical protein